MPTWDRILPNLGSGREFNQISKEPQRTAAKSRRSKNIHTTTIQYYTYIYIYIYTHTYIYISFIYIYIYIMYCISGLWILNIDTICKSHESSKRRPHQLSDLHWWAPAPRPRRPRRPRPRPWRKRGRVAVIETTLEPKNMGKHVDFVAISWGNQHEHHGFWWIFDVCFWISPFWISWFVKISE